MKDATPAASEAPWKSNDCSLDAQARKDAADKAVANLNASIKEKQAALRTAEQALTVAENNLATLKASKASEGAKLVAAEQAVADAKAVEAKLAAEAKALEGKLKDQQNLLAMYKNADKLFGEAVSNNWKQVRSIRAVAKVNVERSKLAELLRDQRDANSQYEAVKKAYEEWLASKKAAEEKAQALSMRQTAKTNDHKQKIRPTIHSSYIYSRTDKQLPQTGEKGSWLALLGMGILASLSFGVRRKQGRKG